MPWSPLVRLLLSRIELLKCTHATMIIIIFYDSYYSLNKQTAELAALCEKMFYFLRHSNDCSCVRLENSENDLLGNQMCNCFGVESFE